MSALNTGTIATGLQASDTNPLVGLDGRAALLTRLGGALKENKELFGEDGRPGNLIGTYMHLHPNQTSRTIPDYLEKASKEEDGTRIVPIAALWAILLEGFNPIWPASRTKLGNISLGDVWPCSVLKSTSSVEGDDLVPFHKVLPLYSFFSGHCSHTDS